MHHACVGGNELQRSHGRGCGQPGSNATALGSKRERSPIFRFASNLPAFHRQVSHVSDSLGKRVVTAFLYVLRDNLFHICTEKPARSLLVGTDHLLIERRSAEMARTGLFSQRPNTPQFCDIWSGDKHVVVYIKQETP